MNTILKRLREKVILRWTVIHLFIQPILGEQIIRSLNYPSEPKILLDHLLAGRHGNKSGFPSEEVTWRDRIETFFV